ncbi:putative RNA-binding protein 46 [Platysternon megacephalum]|uniref:Putative RNA-binding protein 46 n=1 Tax=Platysternon megacephalum TaxID=55544 RepID=A0A4D9EXJ2_9SAUR|nr:putative RNA-binding protein 46 [Platysternon megacephalum]
MWYNKVLPSLMKGFIPSMKVNSLNCIYLEMNRDSVQLSKNWCKMLVVTNGQVHVRFLHEQILATSLEVTKVWITVETSKSVKNSKKNALPEVGEKYFWPRLLSDI